LKTGHQENRILPTNKAIPKGALGESEGSAKESRLVIKRPAKLKEEKHGQTGPSVTGGQRQRTSLKKETTRGSPIKETSNRHSSGGGGENKKGEKRKNIHKREGTISNIWRQKKVRKHPKG